MGKFELKNGARLAAAAGLGLTLALGAAPVVALAEQGISQDESAAVESTASDDSAVMIGDQSYSSLKEAIDSAGDGAVIQINADIEDAPGISIPSGKNLTIDFGGHTYTIGGPGAGSTGTETNGFQLLKNSTLTFRNGTVNIAEGNTAIKRIFQSYADVTFKDLTIDATNQAGGKDYPLSFNNGTVVFSGNTSIVGIESNNTAFDVYYWSSAYPDGVSVTFDPSFYGSIEGTILYDSTDASKAELAVYGNGLFSGIKTSNSSENIVPDIEVFSGAFKSEINESYLAPGVERDPQSGQIVLKDENAAVVMTGSGQVLGGYESLADAINAAPEGGIVNVVKNLTLADTIDVAKEITVTSDQGVEIIALNNGKSSFKLANGAELSGLTIKLNDDVSQATNIVQMSNNSTVAYCAFVGSYDLSNNDSQVCRAIEGSSGSITIQGNTFTNLRQPGYINGGCTGTISGNTVSGTRGWVICGDSDMTIGDNEFGENAVDIAIIPNNNQTNNYSDEVAELSKANSGAYVQNKVSSVEAEDGVIVVGREGSSLTEYTLQAALDGAVAGDTVKLLNDIECGAVNVPEGVTLDGNGKTLSLNEKLENGAFVTVNGDDATVKNVIVDADGKSKHGVQFYCVKDGVLSGVTVNGGYYTAVQVNGSDVTISGCTLNPDNGAYANIEMGMGSGVNEKPSIDLTGQGEPTNGAPFVYVDEATMARAIGVELKEGESLTAEQRAQAVSELNKNLEGAKLTLSENGTATGTKPYVPPVVTGDAVKVEQSEGGKVSVSPSRADEGDEVTVTVIPEDGQELRGLTVTDEDGNAVEVRAGEKDGEFVFTMPDGDVTVSAEFGCDGGVSCPTHGFADVDQSQWYHDAVDWAVTNGVLNGYGDGGELMGPLATITRAEMAQVLWNRAGRPAAEADLSGFADVDASGWYADPVAWCLEQGIFKGYGDTFGTERPISREEVATVLWRLSGSPEPSTGLSSFSDAESVSEYATGALSWAVESGVVTGKDDGTKLDPQGVCTRAEAAAMLMRMSE